MTVTEASTATKKVDLRIIMKTSFDRVIVKPAIGSLQQLINKQEITWRLPGNCYDELSTLRK